MCYMVSLVIQIYYLTYEYDKLFSDFMFHEDKSLSAFSYHCVVILGNIWGESEIMLLINMGNF